jgi:hypothetical protein
MSKLLHVLNVMHLAIVFYSTACHAQQTGIGVYVHTDKYLYNTGETIWFKAYFNPDTQLNETLHVKLVERASNKIVIEREFAAYDIRAHGQIVLPDSIRPGAYNFIAFGNNIKSLNSRTAYIQKITVLKQSQNSLKVKADVLQESNLRPGGIVKIAFNLKEGEIAVHAAKGKCIITSEDHSIIHTTIKIKTDINGIATASFTYPEIGSFEHLYIKGEFTIKDDYAETGLYLPSEKNSVEGSVFIEGGQLIVNAKNKILISLKDQDGHGTKERVILYRDEVSIKSATTDSLGKTILEFTPENDRQYKIVTGKYDTIFLPKAILRTGLKLIDHKTLRIFNSGPPKIRKFELYSGYGKLFSKEINIKESDSVTVSLPDSKINTIISAGLLDKDGNLTNERVFTQGNLQDYIVTIRTTNSDVKPHENVTAEINIKDLHGNPVRANVSVAVVFNKAIDKSAFTSIKNYQNNFIATDSELKEILQQPVSTINDLLIGKKWRNKDHEAGNGMTIPADVKGTIRDKKGRTAYLDRFMLLTANGVKEVNIKNDGTFVIPSNYLIAGEGQTNYIFTNGLKAKNYHIEFDTIANYSKELIRLSALNNKHDYAVLSKDETPPIIAGQNMLKEVVIEKRNSYVSEGQYQDWARDYPENCRDFVCEQNVLNCSNHKTGNPPHLGFRYVYEYNRNFLYTKCLDCDCKKERNTLPLKSITQPESFTVPKFEGDYDLQYYTTLYWNSNLDTKADGTGIFDFSTSDLTGTYKIIIQGLTKKNDEPIYGEGDLNVIPNY